MKICDFISWGSLLMMFVSVSFIDGNSKIEIIKSSLPYFFFLGMHGSSYFMEELLKNGDKRK